jgi:hypothetical protein
MKCFKHDAEVVAVCPWCGRAMCPACASAPVSAGSRLACSDECAKALARNDGALELLLQKSRQSARATSIYYYVCGLISAGAAVGSWHWLGIPFLVWFLGATSVALIVSGFWFGKAAGKNKN